MGVLGEIYGLRSLSQTLNVKTARSRRLDVRSRQEVPKCRDCQVET